jgi:hypothetical protein
VSLIFIVGTGRCGSTALSRVFREHPDVLSVSEILIRMKRALIPRFPAVDGREMWRMFSEPPPLLDDIVCAGLKPVEMCYPYGKGRFDPANGVPAICHSTLPMLSDDPDALFDTLAAEMVTWPVRPVADHFRALFAFLCELLGKSVVVERSGGSVELVPHLRRQFPEARFVHLHRDGPVCAISMSRHPVFRLRGFMDEAARLLGEEPRRQSDIPEQFRGLAVPPFDAERFTSYPIPLTFFAELWSELLCRGVPALAELPPGTWTSLRYEELIMSPAAELSRLAAFIGIPATSQWLAAATPMIGKHRPASAVADLEPAVLAALKEACAPGAQAITAAEARLAAVTGA